VITTNFSSLFDLLPIGAYRTSPDGRQLRANAALVALNGYTSEAEMLACVRDIAHEWYVQPSRRQAFIDALHSQGRVVDFVSEVYRHHTRERIWVREHAHLVRDAGGVVLYFEGTVQDITYEHQAQLALQASESRFRAMTALSSDWYWETDAQHRFCRLDVGHRSLAGGVSADVLGKTRQELAHIELSPQTWQFYQRLLDQRLVFHDFDFPIRAMDGSVRWHSISGEPVWTDGADFLGYRGIGRDVTVRKATEDSIRQMAFHDSLTGLANRRLFMDRLQMALLAMARSGQCAVLIFLDLDKFKALNDSRGHDLGDVLLQQVAQRLRSCVRGVDTVARLGGDEFTVLLEDAGAESQRAAAHGQWVAEKILQSLREPFDLGQSGQAWLYNGSASLGLAVLRDPMASPEGCLKRADAAMYLAKAQGRNCIGHATEGGD
jgi:diguanylate cyclase (GGDEF)-like protein/PAS domain S-box-containing protein